MFRSKDVHLGFSRVRLGRRRFLALTAGALVLGATRLEPSRVAAQDIVPAEGTTPAPGAVSGSEVVPVTPGAGTLYFAETGHNLAEPFRSRWHQAGGETVFGAPLSEERYAAGAGGVLQSFENLVMLRPRPGAAERRAWPTAGQVSLGRGARGPRRRSGRWLPGHERQLPVLPGDKSHVERAIRLVLAAVGWRDAVRTTCLRAIRRCG